MLKISPSFPWEQPYLMQDTFYQSVYCLISIKGSHGKAKHSHEKKNKILETWKPVNSTKHHNSWRINASPQRSYSSKPVPIPPQSFSSMHLGLTLAAASHQIRPLPRMAAYSSRIPGQSNPNHNSIDSIAIQNKKNNRSNNKINWSSKLVSFS